MSTFDPQLASLLDNEKANLEQTAVPIITVSASFKEDIKGLYGLDQNNTLRDVVLSRAHFSMALGIAVAAWGKKIDAKKAWLIDPTNYVLSKDWRSIELTQTIGKVLARHPLLKLVKDLIDTFGRQKLPILKSITPPLLYLTQKIKKPILSLHIAAGNILIEQGKTVVQVITDPHVRDDYLANADNPKMSFCVFDERTKMEFLEKATLRGLYVSPDQVIVTGPPVDPRIVAARHHKKVWSDHRQPLKLCLTTGGLGTNKAELHTLLDQLLPELKKKSSPFQVMLYASTHQDIAAMASSLAKHHHVRVGKPHDVHAAFRVLYHPQIVDANELLIKYGFPWADGFITKPSGDMAYDAVAAGCFLLTLAEWGEWEHNIRMVFEQKNIARQAEIDQIVAQLDLLTSKTNADMSWVEMAMHHAKDIDPLFLNGASEILATVLNAPQK